MGYRRSSTSVLLALLPLLLTSCLRGRGMASAETDDGRKLYVVYMGEKQSEDPDLVTALHHHTLSSVLGSKDAAVDSIVYSYKHGFSGFAAMLTDSQAEQVAGLPGVISVARSRPVKATTTRSWDFLGLGIKNPSSKLLHKARMGEDVIVGIVDTGVWPESKSFSDEGFGPIPSRWKGTCQPGQLFNASHCNRKLIGARWYAKTIPKEKLEGDYLSARDAGGHGTHTASTAAGSIVEGVSFHGLATGLARGGAPRARLAIYKALFTNGGTEAGIAAAIDDAIHDGVDVLSLSIGSFIPGNQINMLQSYATLHAVKKGITVVYAAGNAGPLPETLTSGSPWVITVAASTIDRTFPTTITMGDGSTVVGQGTYYVNGTGEDEFKGLYYGSSNCDENSLPNATDVGGLIALCNLGGEPVKQMLAAVKNVRKGGGAGVILAQYTTNGFYPVAEFPVVMVDLEARQKIYKNAFRKSGNPTVKISPTKTALIDSFTPMVAAFSSRGPSTGYPGVLMPDIAAPGVRILAAVKDSYQFEDGTSMATPHVSGVVALLKSIHPTWSPAAIKSAIVTTGSTMDKYGLPIMAEGSPRKIADPFDFGGGNINPDKAADPGLIYDINPKDYDEYKCLWDYDKACKTKLQPTYSLNLPSISVPSLKYSVTVSRTVTNVGPIKSNYTAMVESPPGINMEVVPSILHFDANTRVQSFTVTLNNIHRMQGGFTFGSLTWVDGVHSVRIPIAVRPVIEELYAGVY